MNVLYVYAHPQPKSFNGLLQQRGREKLNELKCNVLFSDLYALQFHAAASWQDFENAENETQYFLAQKAAYEKNTLAPEIQAEIKKLSQADHIILQFPLWWFGAPAILKGWLDRVLVKGFAYDTGKMFATGLLQGKTVSCVVTTQSPETAYQKDGVHGTTIDTFLLPIHHALRLAGIQAKSPFVAYGVFNLDEARCDEIIKNYQDYLTDL